MIPERPTPARQLYAQPIRISIEERAILRKAALLNGQSVNYYVRRVILPVAEAEVAAEELKRQAKKKRSSAMVAPQVQQSVTA